MASLNLNLSRLAKKYNKQDIINAVALKQNPNLPIKALDININFEVEGDAIGQVNEYFLKKSKANKNGEVYTPRKVAKLMARILDPKLGDEIYDPACGSGRLLVECHLLYKYHQLKFYGQEVNKESFELAKLNAAIHDMDIYLENNDTLQNPIDKQFDGILANPPWNQKGVVKNFSTPYFSRDWAWMQLILSKLKEDGRAVVLLDPGATFRTYKSEVDIRRKFLENGYIESVISLPYGVFSNAEVGSVIIVLNKQRQDKVLLIDASKDLNIIDDYKNKRGILISTEELIKNNCDINPLRYFYPLPTPKVSNGYKIVKLKDIAEVKLGASVRYYKKVDNGDIPLVGAGGIFSYTDKAITNGPTIVVGKKGNAGKVFLIDSPCTPIDTAFYLVPKINIDITYLYNYLQSITITNGRTRTAIENLQRYELEELLIPLPVGFNLT